MAKKMTYKAAAQAHLDHLKAQGWTVKEGLKVPHATKGKLRLWFKAQSVYFQGLPFGGRFELGKAHSLHEDMRSCTTAHLVSWAVNMSGIRPNPAKPSRRKKASARRNPAPKITSLVKAKAFLMKELKDQRSIQTKEGKLYVYEYLTSWGASSKGIREGLDEFQDQLYTADGREFSSAESAYLLKGWKALIKELKASARSNPSRVRCAAELREDARERDLERAYARLTPSHHYSRGTPSHHVPSSPPGRSHWDEPRRDSKGRFLKAHKKCAGELREEAREAIMDQAYGRVNPALKVGESFEVYDPASGKAAVVRVGRSSWTVYFGRKSGARGEFIVSRAKPSKTYKTPSGAHRAANAHVYK